MKKLIYLSILIFALQACIDPSTEEVACLPPPNTVSFIIIDSLTGENVFDNGRFTLNQLEIMANPSNFISYKMYNKDSLFVKETYFNLQPANNGVGIVNITFNLNNEVAIPIIGNIVINTSCGVNYYFTSFRNQDSSIIKGKMH